MSGFLLQGCISSNKSFSVFYTVKCIIFLLRKNVSFLSNHLSQGQAPSKQRRWTRLSPRSNREEGKPHGPKLNRPPKNGNINVQNRYDALSDTEEDYYGTDQDRT